MKILVDSDVLINALNRWSGRDHLLLQLVSEGHDLVSCCITVTEVHAGLGPGEMSAGEELLAGLEYREIAASVAALAGKLRYQWKRRGRSLSAADTLIAALAIKEGLALATDNRRDFPMPELHLVPLPKAAAKK